MIIVVIVKEIVDILTRTSLDSKLTDRQCCQYNVLANQTIQLVKAEMVQFQLESQKLILTWSRLKSQVFGPQLDLYSW